METSKKYKEIFRLKKMLEIMGGLTEEEKEEGYEVIGWLTAEVVFERIKKLEEKK